MLTKGNAGYAGVALTEVITGCGHKPSVARHEVLLWVSVWHVEGRDRVLFGVREMIGLGFVCNGLEGRGALGQCLMETCTGVTLQSAEGPELCITLLLLLLALLNVGHSRVAYLSIAGAVVVQLLWDVTYTQGEDSHHSLLWLPQNTHR